MDELQRLRKVLKDVLKLGPLADGLTERSRLLGALPGLDSLAVISVLASIEREYRIKIRNDELSADVFGTFGSLHRFIQTKLQPRTEYHG